MYTHLQSLTWRPCTDIDWKKLTEKFSSWSMKWENIFHFQRSLCSSKQSVTFYAAILRHIILTSLIIRMRWSRVSRFLWIDVRKPSVLKNSNIIYYTKHGFCVGVEVHSFAYVAGKSTQSANIFWLTNMNESYQWQITLCLKTNFFFYLMWIICISLGWREKKTENNHKNLNKLIILNLTIKRVTTVSGVFSVIILANCLRWFGRPYLVWPLGSA